MLHERNSCAAEPGPAQVTAATQKRLSGRAATQLRAARVRLDEVAGTVRPRGAPSAAQGGRAGTVRV